MLLINAAKRAEVIPTTAFTQLVAPLAQILALALITGLYLAFGRRAGRFGLVAYLLNAFALITLVGVEFVINLVFAELPTSTIDALRDGPLGIALTVASLSFLTGTIAFAVAMIRTREVPVAPLALYAIGAVPVSFRAFVPEAVLDLGLVALAVGAGWLAAWFYQREPRAITTPANTPFSLATADRPVRDPPDPSPVPPPTPQENTMRTPSRSLTAAAAAAVVVATAILAAASGTAASSPAGTATKSDSSAVACRGIDQLAVPGAERLDVRLPRRPHHDRHPASPATPTPAASTASAASASPAPPSRRPSRASSSTATSPTPRPSTPPTAGTTTPSS